MYVHAAQETIGTPPNSNSQTLAPTIDVSGCPMLPGCPEGTSVPLPPGQRPTIQEPKPNGSLNGASNGNPKGMQISTGSGKYAGMIRIPAGQFLMGSTNGFSRPDESPAHNVYLKEYYISKHEITAELYCRFLNSAGLHRKDKMPRIDLGNPECPVIWNGDSFVPKQGMEDKPIVCVSWYGAADFAKWMGGRLPTSAEWEKAALLTTLQPPGDFLTLLKRESSSPVQVSDPGKLGIRGMKGNVWEWCADWYDKNYYANSPSTNPLGPPLGTEKEIRGGSWASAESSKRITNRHKAPPQGYFRTIGFRIVKDR